MKKALLFALALLVSNVMVYTVGYVIGTSDSKIETATHQETSAVTETNLIDEVNSYRGLHNLPALKEDQALDASAQERANEIAKTGKSAWSHTRPDGSQWLTAISARSQLASVGENLAECFDTSSSIVDRWKVSDAHNRNMLGTLGPADYTIIGRGQAWDKANRCMINVIHFGR